jgi:lipopolysaccharide transport protein LptA
MKTNYMIAAIGSLMLFGDSFAQEGNAALDDLIKTVKDNPEGALRAVQQNPDDMLKNAMGVFAEQQKAKDPQAVPASRGPSQTDKAIRNVKNLIATPVTQGQPVLSDSIEKLKKDLDVAPKKTVKEQISNLEANSQFKQIKSAATEAVPGLSNILSSKQGTVADLTGYNRDTPAQLLPSESRAMPVNQLEVREDAGFDTPAIRSGSPTVNSFQQSAPEPIRNMAPTTPQIPDAPELFTSDVPAPQPLVPRYAKPDKFQPVLAAKNTEDSTPKPASDTMVITSNQSVMDNKSHELTFSGDVKVKMDDMWLTCDTLVVYLDNNNEMERIVATGGTVEIQKIAEGGKLQVAKARKAEHVAATNITTLSGGPPYLQNGDQYVNTDSEDSTIVLSGDGKYTVGSPKKSGRTVIVVPIGNSKKLTGDLGFDKKLNNIGR